MVWLPAVLRRPVHPGRAILIAWLLAFVPSIALSAAVGALFPDVAQPNLPAGTLWHVALIVVVAPVLETLIMAGALGLLQRLFSDPLAALISALGWGAAHSLAAPSWGLVIWWPFLIFSSLYLVWRRRSLFAALAVPAGVHMLQNLGPALLLFAEA